METILKLDEGPQVPGPQFSADIPISSAKNDLLNRSGFAAAVGKAISNWKQKSSLVLALFGDWGSGKSSIKNMILETLEAEPPDRRMMVIEFNPWQINDSDRLSQSFFDEIGKAVGRPRAGESDEEASKRAAKWNTYTSYLILQR